MDVGCEKGALSFILSQKARKVMGIDIDPSNIEFVMITLLKRKLGAYIATYYTGLLPIYLKQLGLEYCLNPIYYMEYTKEKNFWKRF